jgi:leader peptidase (prepilin peptidase)/N-methyltransferase
MAPDAVAYAIGGSFAVAIGLVIGSFLDLCIDRMPEDRSVVWPGSACTSCGRPVRPYDNVPVLSWLLLRGRCRDCGAAIPARAPLVELLGGLVGLLLFHRFIPSTAELDLPHFALWAVHLGLIGCVIVAAYTDLGHRIIPNETSIYAVPFGVAGAALLAWLGVDDWLVVSPLTSIVSAAAVGAFFATVAVVARWALGHDGLGWGDVKLITMIASFVGAIPATLIIMLLASVAASVHGVVHLVATRRRAYLPLGPLLALSTLTYVLYGDAVVRGLFPGASMFFGPR